MLLTKISLHKIDHIVFNYNDNGRLTLRKPILFAYILI